MANEYYDNSDTGARFLAGETARGSDVDNKFDQVQAGFDKLPTPDNVNQGKSNYGTDSGSANSYVVTLPKTITQYDDGLEVKFKAVASNSGPSTLNVDSVGSRPLVKQDGTALENLNIVAGAIIIATYDSSGDRFLTTNLTTKVAIADAIDDNQILPTKAYSSQKTEATYHKKMNAATVGEMEAGTGTDPREMTPALIAAAIKTLARGSSRPFTAKGAVNEGEIVVLNDDETVSEVSSSYNVPEAHTATQFSSAYLSGTIYMSSCYDSISGKAVIVHVDDNNHGVAVVVSLDLVNELVTVGQPVTFHSANTGYLKCAFEESSGTVCIFYKNNVTTHPTLITGTVSGDSINFGTPVVVESIAVSALSMGVDSSQNALVMVYRTNAQLSAIAATVSGTTPTLGTKVATGIGPIVAAPFAVIHDSANNRNMFACADLSDSYKRKCVSLTLTGTAISVGAVNIFASTTDSVYYVFGAFDNQNNKYAIAYADNGSFKIVIATPSGTNFTFVGPFTVFSGMREDSGLGFCFDKDTHEFLVTARSYGQPWTGYLKTGIINGSGNWEQKHEDYSYQTGDNHGGEVTYLTGKYSLNLTTSSSGANCRLISTGKVESDYTEWIGIASETVADTEDVIVYLTGAIVEGLSGLTMKAKYYAQEDGSLGLASSPYPVGKAISTTALQITEFNNP